MAMFEHLGYFKEYYINNKFIGTVACEIDNRKIGYCGAIYETTTAKIMLQNKKSIKANTLVKTIIYPLTGKIIKKVNAKAV